MMLEVNAFMIKQIIHLFYLFSSTV